jgi:hypothetical protein
MAKKNIWKLWLRPNLMTQEVENDYYAEVSTAGHTLRNEDIARIIVEQGSEITYEIALATLTKADHIKREKLLAGTSIQDGIVHYTPRVTGNWPGAIPRFSAEHHRLTFDITPTADTRKALAEEVDIEVLGIRDSGAYIGLVTDLSTGISDGKIPQDADFSIEGNKIKILPDDPYKNPNLGIFLIPEVTTDPTIRITSRLIQNTASKIIARIPSDAKRGNYTLQIVTRFSGKTLLNDPRTLTYGETITIISGNDAR